RPAPGRAGRDHLRAQGRRARRRRRPARRHARREGPLRGETGAQRAAADRAGREEGAMNLSEPFIRRPVMTAVLTISAVLFGVLCYFQLPVNDLPTVDYPVIQVDVNYPGAGPETMAANVATPLERQFMQINGLGLVTSKRRQGHSQLTLRCNRNKPLDGRAPGGK